MFSFETIKIAVTSTDIALGFCDFAIAFVSLIAAVVGIFVQVRVHKSKKELEESKKEFNERINKFESEIKLYIEMIFNVLSYSSQLLFQRDVEDISDINFEYITTSLNNFRILLMPYDSNIVEPVMSYFSNILEYIKMLFYFILKSKSSDIEKYRESIIEIYKKIDEIIDDLNETMENISLKNSNILDYYDSIKRNKDQIDYAYKKIFK